METTLTTNQTDTHKEYNFSDNPCYTIQVPIDNAYIADVRIEKFFRKETNELQFTDIEGVSFVPRK